MEFFLILNHVQLIIQRKTALTSLENLDKKVFFLFI